MILKIENLSKSFGNHEVLKNVNLAMDKGEIIAVIGSSGSGKSTMFRCINGLVKPISGIRSGRHAHHRRRDRGAHQREIWYENSEISTKLFRRKK